MHRGVRDYVQWYLQSSRSDALTRVAFTLISAANWMGTGGYNYLVNLAQVLSAHAQDRVQMVLFVGTDTVAANIEPFAAISGVQVVRAVRL